MHPAGGHSRALERPSLVPFSSAQAPLHQLLSRAPQEQAAKCTVTEHAKVRFPGVAHIISCLGLLEGTFCDGKAASYSSAVIHRAEAKPKCKEGFEGKPKS